MGLNPFAAIKNYPEMLDKIATWTFFVSMGCVVILRTQIQSLADLTAHPSLTLPVADLNIPILVVIPAFAVALVSRIAKLHDRVSDILGIRVRFDVESILLPMAHDSGVALTDDQKVKMRKERDRLMGETFYKYASGTNPKIDEHYVTMALDHWSWYWISVEAALVIGLTAIILFLFGAWEAAAWATVLVLLIYIVLGRIRIGCVQYAGDEVREILRDDARKAAISGVFRAL